MRFKTASNPLMHDIMQDMFRSVLEGSKQAHLQHATPAAAQAGSGRRQTQQQQQQAAAPLQAQLLHAQQQLQLQQQQRQQPPPATSPAPAPAAASPAQAEPPAWLMQPPSWWASSPPTPGAAADRGRQMQQPPHDQQRNNQQNPHHQQGGPAFKAGMLPPGQQPRPPPLPPPLGAATELDKRQFEVRGKSRSMYHPFASQFGDRLRSEMSRVYDADNEPGHLRALLHCLLHFYFKSFHKTFSPPTDASHAGAFIHSPSRWPRILPASPPPCVRGPSPSLFLIIQGVC